MRSCAERFETDVYDRNVDTATLTRLEASCKAHPRSTCDRAVDIVGACFISHLVERLFYSRDLLLDAFFYYYLPFQNRVCFLSLLWHSRLDLNNQTERRWRMDESRFEPIKKIGSIDETVLAAHCHSLRRKGVSRYIF